MRALAGVLMTVAVAVNVSACAPQDDTLDDKLVESSARDGATLVQPEQPDVADTTEFAPVQASAAACPREFFCAYTGPNQTGTQVLAVKGNWSGTRSNVGSVINHGRPEPGVDHVELTWHQGGECWKRCVHYQPGPGVFEFNLPAVQITSATWRGECARGEDVNQRCCPGCQ
jgi:hypothetical protein